MSKELEPAKCFGEVKIAVEFRTGAIGETPAHELVPVLFDKFLAALRGCKDFSIWEATVGTVSYDPYKENAGGEPFKLNVDRRVVRMDQ